MLIESITKDEIDIVQRQLGRFPRGIVGVSARCLCKIPLVVATAPLIYTKKENHIASVPFPTTFYLTDTVLVKKISRFESNGKLEIINKKIQDNENSFGKRYFNAHKNYLKLRQEFCTNYKLEIPEQIKSTSVGGMPHYCKCLHAHVGHSLTLGKDDFSINPAGEFSLELLDYNPFITCPH